MKALVKFFGKIYGGVLTESLDHWILWISLTYVVVLIYKI